MKWNIEFDKLYGFVRAYQSGDFSLDDQAAFLSDIVSSPHWQFGAPLMIDFCHLLVDDIFYSEVSSTSDMMTTLTAQLGPGKIALLCDDETQFGLGRQFQMIAEVSVGREIRVYRDEAAAIRFLTEGRASHNPAIQELSMP
jgi:hypothetical protein